MNSFLPRTWADISLDHLEHNYRLIRNHVEPNVKMMAVVKADAYGHGVKFIAPALQSFGADWFAVSNIEEALQLRTLGITKDILILGYTPAFLAKELHANQITQTVFDTEYARQLASYAEKDDVVVNVHIKVDTGMSRIGFLHHTDNDDTAKTEITRVCNFKNLNCSGIFTHFASSDLDGDPNGDFVRLQFHLFCDLIQKLEQEGIRFELRHCCNSAATLQNKDMHLDMVRPGIILYGMEPSSYFRGRYDLKPCMCLKSVVSMVKTLQPGDFVSYGRTYRAKQTITAATIPVGYADGYPRAMSNCGYVLIKKHKAPVIGRVCMDQMVVDVTGIPDVCEGMEVLLFGSDSNGCLPVETFSALYHSINYETVCIVGKRVPRVYYHKGQQIGSLNYVYNADGQCI